jgi:hypothetical protein
MGRAWKDRSPEEKALRKKFRMSPEKRSKEEVEHIERNRKPDGTFGKGTSGFPGGAYRKAKEETYFVNALHECFDQLGGVNGLVAWARKYPSRFYNIMKHLIPVQLTVVQSEIDKTVRVIHAFPQAPNMGWQKEIDITPAAMGSEVGKPAQGGAARHGAVIEFKNGEMSKEEIIKALKGMDRDEKAALLKQVGISLKPR